MYRHQLRLRLKVKVVEVTDGDTVKVIVRKGATPIKVRLHGIDAPELDQEYGEESKNALAVLVEGKVVLVDLLCLDKFRRWVGILHAGTSRQSVNKAMVEIGMAYNWPTYGRVYGGHNAQQRARSKRVGIWTRFGGEVRPWMHRHGGDQTPIEYTKARLEAEAKEKVAYEAKVEAALKPSPKAT